MAFNNNYNEEYTFTFNQLPKTKADLLRLPEASLDNPFKTVALVILALCRYKDNINDSLEMLNVLRGPSPLSEFDKQFLSDRLKGKEYKPYSFLFGATPNNGYTTSAPYRITVSQNPYSFENQNWAVLWVKSSGADQPREFKLRLKPSTGQWFINDILALGDIRIPVSDDPWA